MKFNKDKIIYILVLFSSFLFIFIGNQITKTDADRELDKPYYKAEILVIEKTSTESVPIDDYSNPIEITTVKFLANLLDGPQKGRLISATQTFDNLGDRISKPLEVGDKILVSDSAPLGSDETSYIFIDYLRSNKTLLLVLVFFSLIMLFGRWKGVNTVLSLILSCLAIFTIYIPSIIKGFNIYLSTSIIVAFIIFSTLLLTNGSSKKTWCAIIGNIGGVFLAGVITSVMSKILSLTGYVDTDSYYLVDIAQEGRIDLIAIIWAGVVISSLGAIMDVAMSIASSSQEIAENMRDREFKILFKSGLNIGKDAISTMTNTLILAYIGSSLSIVLLLVGNNKDLNYLFNMEMITVEIMQGVVGSIGILLTVPLTAFVSSYFFTIYGNSKISNTLDLTYQDSEESDQVSRA